VPKLCQNPIPVIPDALSSRGVTHFRNLVQNKIDTKLAFLRTTGSIADKDVPVNFVPTTRLAGIVQFLVKSAGNAASGYTNLHTEQMAALRRAWKTDVITSVGKHMIRIPEAVSAGWPVWNWPGANTNYALKKMMRSICSELKIRIDM